MTLLTYLVLLKLAVALDPLVGTYNGTLSKYTSKSSSGVNFPSLANSEITSNTTVLSPATTSQGDNGGVIATHVSIVVISVPSSIKALKSITNGFGLNSADLKRPVDSGVHLPSIISGDNTAPYLSQVITDSPVTTTLEPSSSNLGAVGFIVPTDRANSLVPMPSVQPGPPIISITTSSESADGYGTLSRPTTTSVINQVVPNVQSSTVGILESSQSPARQSASISHGIIASAILAALGITVSASSTVANTDAQATTTTNILPNIRIGDHNTIALARLSTPIPVLTIDSKTYFVSPAVSGSAIMLDGHTISSNEVITIKGQTISLVSGGEGIVVGGTTKGFPTASIGSNQSVTGKPAQNTRVGSMNGTSSAIVYTGASSCLGASWWRWIPALLIMFWV